MALLHLAAAAPHKSVATPALSSQTCASSSHQPHQGSGWMTLDYSISPVETQCLKMLRQEFVFTLSAVIGSYRYGIILSHIIEDWK